MFGNSCMDIFTYYSVYVNPSPITFLVLVAAVGSCDKIAFIPQVSPYGDISSESKA